MSIFRAVPPVLSLVAIPGSSRPWLRRAACCIGVLVQLGCGANAEELDTTRDHGTGATKGRESNSNSTPPDQTPEAGPAEGQESELDDAETTVSELARKPSHDPAQLSERMPRCAAPLEAEFGYPTFGTEAVRLSWDPATGECLFTSGDSTPEGWSGILTLRHRGEDLFLSGIGDWRYYAPTELELDALPEDQTLTFYPYLGTWQFVVDVRYEGQLVRIERFHYIEGAPPEDYGVPDRTSNETQAEPESNLVPCTSLGEANEGFEVGTLREAVCLVEPPPEEPCSGEETIIPIPEGADIEDLTLLATDLLELRDVNVPGTVAALGLADTVVFSGATIGNIYSRGLVDLRSGATVNGFIRTTTEIVVQGSANYDDDLVDSSYELDPGSEVRLCFPEPDGIDQAPNIFIDPNSSETWPPGIYNRVDLRNDSTLVLSPGVYWFDELQVEPNAWFWINVNTSGCMTNCSVVVNVRSEIAPALRGRVEPPGSDFLLNYRGTEPVILNAAFDGFFLAMDAELRINNNQPHSGAFFAERLYIDAGQTITGRPFPVTAFKFWEP